MDLLHQINLPAKCQLGDLCKIQKQNIKSDIQGVFLTGTHPKSSKYKKVRCILADLRRRRFP